MSAARPPAMPAAARSCREARLPRRSGARRAALNRPRTRARARSINDQRGPSVTVDSLLKRISIPVLLLWGDLDPWIVPSRAAKILELYPRWAGGAGTPGLGGAAVPSFAPAGHGRDLGRRGPLPPPAARAAPRRAKKVGLQSGHCPHDDTPEEANAALLQWLGELEGGRLGA